LDRIENGINKQNYYVNNLNIFPSIVRTHNSYIFNNVEDERAYIYERNDVMTEINKEDKIYVAFNIWLKNTVNHYERTYKRLQDVIPNIGGINQIVIFISVCINKFYNKYIEIIDTDTLLFSSIKKRKRDRKKIIANKNMDLKYEDLNKEKKNELVKKSNDREKNNEKLNKKMEKNKNDINISGNNNFFYSSEELYHIPDNHIKSSENRDNINNKSNVYNIYNIIASKISEEKKTFCKFILFKLLCGKKYKWFGIYQNFRKKIISEEHLIKNYLNIYNLLKASENKKRFKKNYYLLEDLINLV
jgi:hypothetical protein